MTTVPAGRASAGTWKHRDFPAPVGMMASTSSPARMARITSSCTGRKLSYPKKRFNISGGVTACPPLLVIKIQFTLYLIRLRAGMPGRPPPRGKIRAKKHGRAVPFPIYFFFLSASCFGASSTTSYSSSATSSGEISWPSSST